MILVVAVAAAVAVVKTDRYTFFIEQVVRFLITTELLISSRTIAASKRDCKNMRYLLSG